MKAAFRDFVFWVATSPTTPIFGLRIGVVIIAVVAGVVAPAYAGRLVLWLATR